MTELVIKPKSVINVVYEGKSYPCKRPTLGRAAALEDDLLEAKKRGSKASADVMYKFLEDSGLPRNIAEEFDVDQLNQLVETFAAKKKS